MFQKIKVILLLFGVISLAYCGCQVENSITNLESSTFCVYT